MQHLHNHVTLVFWQHLNGWTGDMTFSLCNWTFFALCIFLKPYIPLKFSFFKDTDKQNISFVYICYSERIAKQIFEANSDFCAVALCNVKWALLSIVTKVMCSKLDFIFKCFLANNFLKTICDRYKLLKAFNVYFSVNIDRSTKGGMCNILPMWNRIRTA